MYRSSISRRAIFLSIFEPLESRRFFSAGNLDPGFGGGDGLVSVPMTGIEARAERVMRLADGRLLIFGNPDVVAGPTFDQKLRITRLQANGDLDTAFGTGGHVITSISVGSVRSVAIDPVNGTIAVAGAGGISMFNADGTPDSSFTGAGAAADVSFIAFQGDKLIAGKTVNTTEAVFNDNESVITISRFNSNGSQDGTFGIGGVVRITDGVQDLNDDNSEDRLLASISVTADGRIIVGTTYHRLWSIVGGDQHRDAAIEIIRLNVDGARDSTFDDDGLAQVYSDSDKGTVRLNKLNLDADGSMDVLWATITSASPVDDFTYHLSGVSSAGDITSSATLQFSTTKVEAHDFQIDSQGRIIVSGRVVQAGPKSIAGRFFASGKPDLSYATNGFYTTPDELFESYDAATTVLPSGAVVMAGTQPTDVGVGYRVTQVSAGDGAGPAITLNRRGTLVLTTNNNPEHVQAYIRSRDGRLVVRIDETFAQSFAPSRVKRMAIYTLGGEDTITIGNGVRSVYVESGDDNDTINGGQGDDVLLGGFGKDRIFGNDGNDKLIGGGSNDYLLGGAGKDDLFGNGGNDTLSGAGGNDRLFGGEGVDRISGGTGIDSAPDDPQDVRSSDIETLLASI